MGNPRLYDRNELTGGVSKDLTSALRFAGNQSLAERRNPLCYDNEITGQGKLERSEGEIETEIWPIDG